MPVQPYFGWVMWNVSKENYKTLKQRYPTFPKAEEGVFVQKVIIGFPAYRAGVQDGDVIVDFNGKKVRHMNDMMKVMGKKSVAAVDVIVKRFRPGKDRVVPLTISFEQKDVAAPRSRL
ncbi:serine protease HTRA2, mitochondrial-like [Eucalyptus grandis]|uniref:serine protease HTRA2, mitochondrial-like n=1 Tax=Eucalyptus grandis TaxID=71139 RepID=UPI00192ED0E5|nr:serine protease HTRA2, mitochondrial-like [Eucalyptus grandis]